LKTQISEGKIGRGGKTKSKTKRKTQTIESKLHNKKRYTRK
jgi:hypothetical protein